MTWNWSKDCFSIWMPTIPKELSLEESLEKEFGVSRLSYLLIFTESSAPLSPGLCELRRLDYARDLLLSTELSVTQIALDVGFGSSAFFSGLSFRLSYHSGSLPQADGIYPHATVPRPPGYNPSRYERSVPGPGSGTFPPSPPYPRLPLPGPPDQILREVCLFSRSHWAGHYSGNKCYEVLLYPYRYSIAVPLPLSVRKRIRLPIG